METISASPEAQPIVISGAREHNLKDVSLRIPKGCITVFTGVSGSGKSSLVFQTLAAESQRQLNETFPSFVRYRLPQHERPNVDELANLTTTVVVDQRPVGRSARSTVGTMTEAYTLLRILFSRCAEPGAGESTAYSFNDPRGMCPECDGLGRTRNLDTDRVLDSRLSLNDGAIQFPAFAPGTVHWQLYAQSGLFDPDLPLSEFTADERNTLLYGKGFTVPRRTRTGTVENAYEGVALRLERLYLRKDPTALTARDRAALPGLTVERRCPRCHGLRLNEAALASRIAGRNLSELCSLEVTDLIQELHKLDGFVARRIAGQTLQILERIEAIGLGYLSLDRETTTLSGGEAQRLKTVRHLGSSLTGLTYVFDEPSIGLHPRDVYRLNDLLRALRDKGNTVLVIEHDRDVIAIADHVVDIGPHAGVDGGSVVFEGPLASLYGAQTPTAHRLRTDRRLTSRKRRSTGSVAIRNASSHNLRNISIDLPAGVFTVISGVAGSGKSTLVTKDLVEQHPSTILIDQSATGISPRSVPATYVDIMDDVRRRFAAANGVRPSLFSFNSAGACPECNGRGEIRTDLAFMDPVTATCERCGGTRFGEHALGYTLGGRTIADVLNMTAADAHAFFAEETVRSKLAPLVDVGLGYITLGQPLSTLSGGERQRLKLAHRLQTQGSVYVFDEPTTGLHMADIDVLLAVIDRLVDAGNSVIAVEHDLDVIAHADWVVDMGPEAGQHGGRVVFEGTPEQLLCAQGSHTAEHLRRGVGR